MNTVKIIISLAAHFGWEMLQFDVKMPSYMEAWKKKCTWRFHLDMVPLMEEIKFAD